MRLRTEAGGRTVEVIRPRAVPGRINLDVRKEGAFDVSLICTDLTPDEALLLAAALRRAAKDARAEG